MADLLKDIEDRMLALDRAPAGNKAAQDLLKILHRCRQEIGSLRTERDDLKSDYLRRHNDAVDCFEETIRLRTILANLSQRHEGYEQGCGPCVCEWHQKARAELSPSQDTPEGE